MSDPRTASVLFADIAGFTAIAERLDPEEVTELVNRCFEAIEGVVIAHGGWVDKYLGDCVLAVFGLAGEADAATAAVEAALEIRHTMRQLSRTLALPALDVHAGVATGAVIAGEVRRERSVSGDAVTLAARLEDRSETGQILVDAATAERSAAAMRYRPAGTIARRDDAPPLPVHELTGPRDASARIRRPSERRHAAVLFAELSWSAGERSAPAEIPPALLDRCVGALEEVVTAHGGTVDKVIGTSLMALFGVPSAIEHAAQEAVNAAIELRNRLARFAAEEALGGGFDLHVGVNAGLMVAGEVGGRVRRTYTVMGDAVNLAARLKDAAAHGTILVGPEVHRATAEAFAYRALAPMRFKGKADPVPTFEVLSRHEHVHRARGGAADHLVARLVGRERDLQLLRDRLAALCEGRGAVVSLTGEAGVGKSRLAAELRADAAARRMAVLEGRATAMGANLSYHPFVDLLRRWAAIGEEDEEPAARARLARAVAAQMGAAAAEALPLLATLMGMPPGGADGERLAAIEGEALERLLARSVRDLLQSLAATAPVLLLLDDLHWADQSSIRLLESLYPLVADHPILVLQIFRPDHADAARRSVAAALPDAANRGCEIALGPLGDHQAVALIENLLQIEHLPHGARRQIVERAEGNPFFIEEVVRSLIDQGAVERVRGRYRFTAKLDTVVIPDTVQEVIMARVDRLAEPTRHLLRVASVIGRSFHYRLITEILRHEGELDDGLDRELSLLREKQLLVQRRTAWGVAVGAHGAGAELEYLFTHSVAQQTIYESILQRTRKELHAVVAAAIERVFADRLADFHGMLAYHYSRADDLPKAEEYLFKAGESAARAAASREALRYFQEAARLYLLLHPDGGELQKRMLLETKIAVALWNVGDLSASIEHFDATLGYLGDRRRRGAAAAALTFAADATALLYRLYRGPAGDGRDLERVREIASVSYMKGRAQTTSDPVRVFIDAVHGMRWLNRSDPARIDQAAGMYATMAAFLAYSGLGAGLGVSFALSRRCLQQAERLLRPGNVGDAFAYQSMRFIGDYLAGRWAGIAPVDDELVEAALHHGLFWDVGTYLNLDCDRLVRQGRFAEAQRRLDRLAALADDLGYAFARSGHDGQVAHWLLEQRRLDEALAAIDAYCGTVQDAPLLVFALGTLTKVQVLRGDRRAAAQALADADAALRRAGVVPPWQRNFHAVARLRYDVTALAEAAAQDAGGRERRRLAAAARRSLRTALAVGAQVRTQRTEIFRLAGSLHWHAGRRARACAWWTRSVDEGLRMEARPELARTYRAAADRLAAHPRLRVAGLDAAALKRRADELFAALQLGGPGAALRQVA